MTSLVWCPSPPLLPHHYVPAILRASSSFFPGPLHRLVPPPRKPSPLPLSSRTPSQSRSCLTPTEPHPDFWTLGEELPLLGSLGTSHFPLTTLNCNGLFTCLCPSLDFRLLEGGDHVWCTSCIPGTWHNAWHMVGFQWMFNELISEWIITGFTLAVRGSRWWDNPCCVACLWGPYISSDKRYSGSPSKHTRGIRRTAIRNCGSLIPWFPGVPGVYRRQYCLNKSPSPDCGRKDLLLPYKSMEYALKVKVNATFWSAQISIWP